MNQIESYIEKTRPELTILKGNRVVVIEMDRLASDGDPIGIIPKDESALVKGLRAGPEPRGHGIAPTYKPHLPTNHTFV